MLVLIIKIKKKGFALNLITLAPLLLPFKEIKGLNAKMLRSSFLFKGKIPKIKKKDLKFNKSISLKDVFAVGSL